MSMAMHYLALDTIKLSAILLNILYTTRALVIYVDPENGIEDPSCWTGGINLPCKHYELAKEGALYLNISTHDNIHVLSTSSSNSSQTCRKKLLQDHLCRPYKHTTYDRGAVWCNANGITVRNCDCVTYTMMIAVFYKEHAHMGVGLQLTI